MMKKFFSYGALLTALLSSGCEKYLDKEPDNRTQVKTPEQIEELQMVRQFDKPDEHKGPFPKGAFQIPSIRIR